MASIDDRNLFWRTKEVLFDYLLVISMWSIGVVFHHGVEGQSVFLVVRIVHRHGDLGGQ